MVVSAMLDDLWAKFVTTRRPELYGELITKYVPLVRFVVGQLRIPQTSLFEADALISYGLIGLINAIDRFDPSRGVHFETFAKPRIRGAVIDQLRVLNWLPRLAVARVRHIETALAHLEQCLGRPAKEREAAEKVGVSVESYRQMLLEMSIVVLSLDALSHLLIQNDEMTSWSDSIEDTHAIGPAQQVEQQEIVALLSAALERLPERERLLLSLYYQEQLTMKEISSVMNISRSRVCQLHMHAILRLRSALQVDPDHDHRQGANKLFAISKRKSCSHQKVHHGS